MLVEATCLAREASYLSIAEQRSAVNGISEIVNALLEGVFLGFEDHGVKMSPEIRFVAKSTTGQKMEDFLLTEYTNKLVGVYQKALTSLSEEALDEIAQHPERAFYSEAYGKFLQLERMEFMPIKEKTINELMEAGTKLISDDAAIAEIHQIADLFSPI